MRLPDALRGLGCLAVEGRCPRVEIRVAKRLRNKLKPGRKLRGNANAGIFDPDIHLIVVDFGESHDGASAPSSRTRSRMERQLEECFGAEARRQRGRFAPIRIRGANVSDAVIEDRRFLGMKQLEKIIINQLFSTQNAFPGMNSTRINSEIYPVEPTIDRIDLKWLTETTTLIDNAISRHISEIVRNFSSRRDYFLTTSSWQGHDFVEYNGLNIDYTYFLEGNYYQRNRDDE